MLAKPTLRPLNSTGKHMQIKTVTLIANACDDEYDNMALLCCHGEGGDLFSLTRFPDENKVEITVGDDTSHNVSNLKVTFGAQRLLVEIAPADARQLKGHEQFEIIHGTDADELAEVHRTLHIIMTNVGEYVSEVD
ncbi:hypothetical protein ALP73_03712 [Pseudomonas coronafaciens pv. garcae]|uniref:Uncharacterized protein n=3 Tax=Pseudomonas syringae group TaxID=136849 RepID=A0AB37QL31_9PSED|nr:Uncharacterized protein ALO77_03516 [Pseudomonas coronafaciens pv. garcae]KPY09366.1 Uncharacterized protein ALO57_02745 [Pseudomonas coronafaciens pv. oryzae]RMM85392.1 hypothetical protein ALQ71_04872 [Pseudomonas coronafaciens pv. striafaciens]RMN31742.1 hypothetical protein ALQ61_04756 [Pseudomonas coronafaciens pv. zizaniae]RMN90469.1 hypothetical protein ALQ50_00859 [Pseudomonas coronafaciens pv. coronafaciens]RMV64970.1 hypothetical protein ALP06_00780 [Pseudomonas coronafaciens pv. 